MKLIALLTIQALAASAFTSVPSPVSRSALKHHQSTASQLFAATGETDGSISRREALQVASAAAVLASTNIANADDEAPGGKLIEFTVNNLDGEEGKTGSFVVKTRPGKYKRKYKMCTGFDVAIDTTSSKAALKLLLSLLYVVLTIYFSTKQQRLGSYWRGTFCGIGRI